mgnify:FL=1
MKNTLRNTALAAVMCLFILGGCAEARSFDMNPTSWSAGGAGISAVTKSQEQAVISGETLNVLRIDYTVAPGNNTLEVGTYDGLQGGNTTFVGGPITFWVYGNGCNRKILLRLIDATGEVFQFGGPKINWSGSWQQVVFSNLSAGNAETHFFGNNDGIIDGILKLNVIGVDYWANPQQYTHTFRFAKVEVGLPAGVPEAPTAVSGRVVESKSGLICPEKRPCQGYI